MADFQRARSKVWYPSLDDDDEDMHHHHHHQQQHQHHQLHLRHHSWRRQPSSSPESRRVSSGSPSNGSHRSQDSGFSDSESGSPLGPSSKPSPTAAAAAEEGTAAEEGAASEGAAAAVADAAVICTGRPGDDGHATTPDPFAADGLPRGVLPEGAEEKADEAAGIASPCGRVPREQRPEDDDAPPPQHCDCFLPACELSRKFRSYDYASPFRPPPVSATAAASAAAANRRAEEEPRTPNRTCFIVDELPKSGGPRTVPVLQSTPGSVKSFDGHFDQSENVTVVENVKRDDSGGGGGGNDSDVVLDDGDSIIDPPVPFVDERRLTDDRREYDATSVCSSVPDRPDTPEHTSTPKSTRDRCCTPKLQCRKELQLKRPKSSRNLIDRTERENEVPVGQWLNELRFRCEPECMTTLQSKSIATSEDAYRMSAIVCTDSGVVRELYQRTKAISDEFKKVYNDLNKCRVDNFGPSVQTLTGLLLDFVCDHENELPEYGQELCMDLVDVSERLRIHANRRLGNRKIILNDVSALGQIFSELVDALLLKKIQSLVNILEEPSTDIELVKAMSSINSLGLESVHLGSLVTKCNGIRSLLTVCIDAVSSTVRSAALRTLAMVCCSSNSVRQFEKAGGVEILSDLLGSKNRSEKELTDAVSVLAQITAPWIEDNHVVNGLNEYLDIFISTLTYLVETTQSSETLLLSSAALANITFIEPKAIRTILHMGTAGSLIEAVRKNGTKSSVFLQEQTATLLANMAAVPETRPHMAANHAVIALLCFLQVRHSPLQRVPEILAAERLQHKTAIALSRLCSDVEVSKQVVELEGVNRLIRLCKDERERNHSDGVLVACLASLRKIAANCGKDIMNQFDAAELIEPRLLDSFLLYSSKQESYV